MGRGALTIFVVIGVIAMAGGVVLGILLNRDQGQEVDPASLPTAAAEEAVVEEPDATEAPEEATDAEPEIVRNFDFADRVIDEVAETYTATISTAKGDIVIELFADIAPNTVNSFVFLAEKRFFDGIVSTASSTTLSSRAATPPVSVPAVPATSAATNRTRFAMRPAQSRWRRGRASPISAASSSST